MGNKKVIDVDVKNKKLKTKKMIVVLLLIVIIPLVLFFGYRIINKKLDEINASKMSDTINDINKEKISYVFIEINPSFVLTVKDNVVSDIACLNEDCMSMYSELNVKNKNINESIDTIYNVSKEKGFDTSNGVKIKSTDSLNIENKDYIEIEYIDTTKEKELLDEVKNNDNIKNVNNEDYYSRLLEELKKDKEYDNVYTCSMDDSKKLECNFIVKNLELNESSYYSVLNTLKKFDVKVIGNDVYINDMKGKVQLKFGLNDKEFRNVIMFTSFENLPNGLCDDGFYPPDEEGLCRIEVYNLLPLESINLLNINSSLSSIHSVKADDIVDTALEKWSSIQKNNGNN